jgi:ABC-type transport system substrate-binding protein
MDGQNRDENERIVIAGNDIVHKRSARKVLFAVAFTAVFLLSACSAIAMGAKADDTEKIFVEAMGEGVQSANPFIGIYDSDYMLYSYIYDYLMYPNQDGNATPNLAKNWWHMDGATAFASGSTQADLLNRNYTQWPQGSIWEYNLTEGVTWNDGAPFDADDVVFTIALQTGVNYPNFWAYQPYTKWIDHAQKMDQYRVRYYFTDRTSADNHPIPVAWGSCISLPIMPKHILQDLQPVNVAQDWKGVPAIGTGPFMGTDILQSEIIAKEKITLVKNPEWERGLGRIYNRTCEVDKLIMKFYSEEQVLVLDLKTKKIDATELTAINYLSLKNASDNPPELRLVSQFSSTVYTKISHFNFLIGGTAPGTLNPSRVDPAIHRATAIATDRDYIVNEIFRGLAIKGVGLLTPVFPKWYYDAWNDTKNNSWFNVTSGSGAPLYSYHDSIAHVMDFNLARANEILNASGYTWATYPTGYRTIGSVAADRLVAMGVVASPSAAMYDSKGNPRILEYDDIYEQEVFEDQDISKYFATQWAKIGIHMIPTAVNTATWNKVVYGFQECFTETYWSGDPDPNYLLYVPSNFSMDGWNEWGRPTYDPDGWVPSAHGGKHYYDYAYEMSAQTFNTTQRVYWVHECEKSLFLSGTRFLVTANPMNSYGYLDWRWTNWGDWVAHPGLQVDHFWGETPLFMKIKWNPNAGGTGGGDMIIPIAVAIAAIVAVVAVVVIMRKQKTQKMMQEEEEEEELEDEEEELD